MEEKSVDFDSKSNVTYIDKLAIILLSPIRRFNKLSIIRILVLRSTVKNWYEIILFKLGIKGACIAHLKSGKAITINDAKSYISLWGIEEIQQEMLKRQRINAKVNRSKKIVEFQFMGGQVLFSYDSPEQLAEIDRVISDQFVEESYKWLDVKGKDVIDVGAYIGDSAIYFALKGARHVYAFEPYPYSYSWALKNVKLNNLEEKITMVNEGCGEKASKVRISEEYHNISRSSLKSFDKGHDIRVSTLGDIVERFNIQSAILKVDCEGCEYGFLLEAKSSDLKRFEQIQIEYHNGYLNLKKKLEQSGFKVLKTFPKKPIKHNIENKNTFIGMIYGRRGT